jgi:hypothetical protein
MKIDIKDCRVTGGKTAQIAGDTQTAGEITCEGIKGTYEENIE